MSKTVVLYRTKYGTTEKYARWIAQDTGADVFDARRVRIQSLMDYDTIVYCGGLYAGGILGFSRIKKNDQKLADKKLLVAAVGATTKSDEARKEVMDKNLTASMKGRVPLFLLRGGLDYKNMNVKDRLLMFLLYTSIKSKDPDTLDNDSKGILATYGKTVDFTNRAAIEPIVAAIRA